jgi:drug/metabolite transporter (DMT)-like permease
LLRPLFTAAWRGGLRVGAILGAGLLSATSAFGRPGLGDALILLAALLRAILVTQTRRLATRHTLPALTLTALQSAVVTLGLLALTLVLRGPHWPVLPTQMSFWGGMAFLVLLCTVFAFFAQNYAAARTSPSRVSLLMGSEPVFGALFAVLWLGEQMTRLGWVGGAVMVLVAWYATRTPKPATA